MKRRYTFLTALLSWSSALFAQSTPPDYRPVYHFTPEKNWINDPNGLVYYDGEYHLFYQHNPFGNEWGHMSWGHAVSSDLVQWDRLPLAIPEFTMPGGKAQTSIFSGSSVIDKGNKSGICPPGTPDCMVAIYTGNVTTADGKQLAQYQNMAYSANKGRAWTQYEQNPIIDIGSKEFRDPNVFWYAPQQKWVMATVKATEHRVALYESKDLKKWAFMSYFGNQGDTSKVWECPALMPVPVKGASARGTSARSRSGSSTQGQKWVLFISAGHPQADYVGMQYFVGTFNGKEFKLDPANPRPLAPAVMNVVDWGKDYYAAIQYNGLPTSQPGPVMIGWLNNWAYAGDLPTTPFKGAMSLPRQISLKRTQNGLQLVQQPIEGITRLRGDRRLQKVLRLTNQSLMLDQSTTDAYELELEIVPGAAKTVGLKLAKGPKSETIIQYADGLLQLDRRQSGNVSFNKRFASVESAPLALQNGAIKLRIFVDRSIIEVFANDGERVITDQIFPTDSNGGIELFVDGGSATFKNITRWTYKQP